MRNCLDLREKNRKQEKPSSALHSGLLPALSLSGPGLRLASHMFKSGVAGLKGPVLDCAL